MSRWVSAKYIVRPSGEKARPFGTPMPLLTVTAEPSASTRWSRPVAGRGPSPEAMAGSEHRPDPEPPGRVAAPVVEAVAAGPAASRTIQSVHVPDAQSRNARRPSMATSRRSGVSVRASDAGPSRCGDLLIEAGGRVEAMDRPPVDVHPVETGLRRAPRRALARAGHGLEGRTSPLGPRRDGSRAHRRRRPRRYATLSTASAFGPAAFGGLRPEATRPARARTSRDSRRPRAPRSRRRCRRRPGPTGRTARR